LNTGEPPPSSPFIPRFSLRSWITNPVNPLNNHE
jgi:hypothetical protein